MWMDVIDLRDFYRSGPGRTVRVMIRRQVRTMWPDVSGLSVLGLGYATPYLGMFREEAGRVMAAMPAPQGVLHWPAEGSGLTTLTEETELPFPDLSIDRLLLIHALEFTEHVRPLMREAWRVLAGNGRLLVVVPNRRGIWARFERTPLGHGQPYSPSQLSRLLRETLFTPVQSCPALFTPPLTWRVAQSSAPAVENIGRRWFAHFSGVLMAEATKQIYAGPPHLQAHRRAWAAVGDRLGRPVPAPPRRESLTTSEWRRPSGEP